MADKILTEAYDKLRAIEEGDLDEATGASSWDVFENSLARINKAWASLKQNPSMNALVALDREIERLPTRIGNVQTSITKSMSDDEVDDFYNG